MSFLNNTICVNLGMIVEWISADDFLFISSARG